jgi:lysozyme
MATTPGIDVSHHQGRIDWKQVADAGYRFAIVRASYGGKTVDSRFVDNWEGAKAAGLLVSSYHFMLPALLAEGAPNRPLVAPPEEIARLQAEHWFRVLEERRPDFPLCLDVETDVLRYQDANNQTVTHRVSRDVITQIVREFLRLIEARDNRRAIIYTSRSKWNNFIERSAQWSAHDLWVANYVNNPATTTPGIPDDWTDWKIWQYGEHGVVPGISTNTDMNLFSGSLDDLQAWAGTAGSGKVDTPPPDDTQPDSPAAALQARVAVTSLNVRSGPGVHFSKVGTLNLGDVVSVQAVDGSSIWVEFAPDQWVAAELGSQHYLTIEAAADGSLQARVTAPSLNVRRGPGTSFSPVGQLAQDAVVPVRDLGGGDVWLRIAPEQWAVLIFNGQRFMTVVR